MLAILAVAPCAAWAQKIEANAPPKTYFVGKEKTPIYRNASDTTAAKQDFFLLPGEEVTVVGVFSPQWFVVKRQGFLYLAGSKSLSDPNLAKMPTVPRTEEYCMILATQKFLSTKVTIAIDFGQERRFFSDSRYKDAEGRVQSFNSVIDVLNYQNGQGWEFVNAYVITVSSQNVYHYVMKRQIAKQ